MEQSVTGLSCGVQRSVGVVKPGPSAGVGSFLEEMVF